MVDKKWYINLGLVLVIVSVIVYSLQMLIFRRYDETGFYLLQDLAFVPVQVLLVMLIIDRLLRKKEKEAMLGKLNMLIGVFFNEVGTGLMGLFMQCMRDADEFTQRLGINGNWSEKDFADACSFLKTHQYRLECPVNMLSEMRQYLLERRNYLSLLLQNPNLLEHDTFTDLLWSVFHLADELYHRRLPADLPATDLEHLYGDIGRACGLVMTEWLEYMKHLKEHYPYLYSIQVRTNPFNPQAGVMITD